MSGFIDLTGKNFDDLFVLKMYGIEKKGKHNESIWLCKCKCGNYVIKDKTFLCRKTINSKNCGCKKRTSRRKHNMAGTRIYKRWVDMKYRCYGNNRKDFADYGGRGITVCDEWLHDFNAFYRWSMENGYRDDLTLDRIDVNGNYEPSNCRWTTAKVQAHNRRNTIYVTYHGETLPLPDLCERYNAIYSTVSKRYKRGWDLDRCLFSKPHKKNWNGIGDKQVCNEDIYNAMVAKGLNNKTLAKLINRCPTTVSHLWRNEINPKRKAEILKAIEECDFVFTTPEESGAKIMELLTDDK